jgi:hypothetical protein
MFPELASTLVLRNPTLRVAHNVGQERSKRRGDAQTLTTWMETALLSVSSFRSLSRRDLAPADRDHKDQGLDSIMAELLPM